MSILFSAREVEATVEASSSNLRRVLGSMRIAGTEGIGRGIWSSSSTFGAAAIWSTVGVGEGVAWSR